MFDRKGSQTMCSFSSNALFFQFAVWSDPLNVYTNLARDFYIYYT